jgi:hypothetical protein
VKLIFAILAFMSTSAFAVDYQCTSTNAGLPRVRVQWHETAVDRVDVRLEIWRLFGYASYRFDDARLLRPDQYTGRVEYETEYDTGMIDVNRRFGYGSVDQTNGLHVDLECR